MPEDTLEARACPKCSTDKYVMLITIPQMGIMPCSGHLVRCDKCGKETEPHVFAYNAIEEWNAL